MIVQSSFAATRRGYVEDRPLTYAVVLTAERLQNGVEDVALHRLESSGADASEHRKKFHRRENHVQRVDERPFARPLVHALVDEGDDLVYGHLVLQQQLVLRESEERVFTAATELSCSNECKHSMLRQRMLRGTHGERTMRRRMSVIPF